MFCFVDAALGDSQSAAGVHLYLERLRPQAPQLRPCGQSIEPTCRSEAWTEEARIKN